MAYHTLDDATPGLPSPKAAATWCSFDLVSTTSVPPTGFVVQPAVMPFVVTSLVHAQGLCLLVQTQGGLMKPPVKGKLQQISGRVPTSIRSPCHILDFGRILACWPLDSNGFDHSNS